MSNLDKIVRALGTMFGGAFGDALGLSVSSLTQNEIKERFGSKGITEPIQGRFKALAVSDDTQQAVAVGHGLLAACFCKYSDEVIIDYVWCELKSWRSRQFLSASRRDPDAVSLSVPSGLWPGTLRSPPNNSSHGIVVSRAHPIGIAFLSDVERAFRIGIKIAVLTHGNTKAMLAAGYFATLISMLCNGSDLKSAEELARYQLLETDIESAYELAKLFEPSLLVKKTISELMPAETAPNALAIGLRSVLKHPDSFDAAVQNAVNRDGYANDTTGAIAGAIAGALHGIKAIPRLWQERLELCADLTTVANCLAALD